MKTLKLVTIVGARPQFVKAAALSRAIAAFNGSDGDVTIDERIVHTGQHYDENMSKVFFDELGIPAPQVNIEVGSAPHGRQTGEMLSGVEQILLDERPDLVLVYGDANSTLAGALAAAKLSIPVAHVEAGVQDRMQRTPEAINGVLADCVATLLLCPTERAARNLAECGITEGVHNVGDVMHDSFLRHLPAAREKNYALELLGLKDKSYYLLTVHRAENADDPSRLSGIVEALGNLGKPVVWPLHPRTREALREMRAELGGYVHTIAPVGYLDMISLEAGARIILTDSGGVQKEAYWSSVPCVTLRDETEWGELLDAGCNRLAGTDAEKILAAVAAVEAQDCSLPTEMPTEIFGDGRSAEKIVSLLAGSVLSVTP